MRCPGLIERPAGEPGLLREGEPSPSRAGLGATYSPMVEAFASMAQEWLEAPSVSFEQR